MSSVLDIVIGNVSAVRVSGNVFEYNERCGQTKSKGEERKVNGSIVIGESQASVGIVNVQQAEIGVG